MSPEHGGGRSGPRGRARSGERIAGPAVRGGEEEHAESDHGDRVGGGDDIYGGDGRDVISAGRGDDFIDVQGDGRVDQVDCGSGRDVVRANPEDDLPVDCEVSKAVTGPK